MDDRRNPAAKKKQRRRMEIDRLGGEEGSVFTDWV